MWSFLSKMSGIQKPTEEEKKEPPKKEKQRKGESSVLKSVKEKPKKGDSSVVKSAKERPKKGDSSVMKSAKEKESKRKKLESSGSSSKSKSKSSSSAVSRDSSSKSSQVSKNLTIDSSKVKLVKGFVESTLSLGVKGLVAEFRGRKRTLDVSNMSEFVVQQPNGRNRYKDVGCLDATRVKLSLGPVEYIHANYVSTPSNPKKFICTQAPIQKTCSEFWNLIVQEKSSVILMLCNLYERGAAKCAPYFPQEAGASLTFADGDVTIVSKSREPFPFVAMKTKVKIIVSQLEVTVKGQEMHPCTHYHWMDWPDRGVPEADMAPIQLLNSLKHNDKPIVVHCSAGIGRTGSMVLLQHVLELLNEKKEVGPIVDYMDELRKQRHNSVQTEHQYLYVHMVMLMYLKKTGYLENSDEVKKRMETFTKDYEKITAPFA